MRKLITLLMAVFLATTTISAQSEHLTFLGVEIAGTQEDFMDRLSKIDSVKVYNTNTAFVDLDKRAKVVVVPSVTYISKKVFAVNTTYIWNKDWNELITEYERLAKVCQNKYGNPINIKEGAIGNIESNETYSLGKLVSGELEYCRTWQIDSLGTVILMIKPIQIRNWAGVVIRYEDAKGRETNIQEWERTLR